MDDKKTNVCQRSGRCGDPCLKASQTFELRWLLVHEIDEAMLFHASCKKL